MPNYYVRFNFATNQVDVYEKVGDILVQSVEVINGVVPSLDVEQIAFVLGLSDAEKDTLEYDIFYEDRFYRELLGT